MLLHIDVAQDVVVDFGVFTRFKVPWFLPWIIRIVFQSLQFVVKVHNIKGLFISECTVLTNH